MRVDVRKTACWILGAAASMSILAHASGYSEFNPPVMVVFAGLALLLAVLFTKLSARSEWFASSRTVLPWLLFSAVLAAGLYYVLPLRANAFHRTGWLVVTGSEQRDASSRGSEVWATVRKPDGQAVAPDSIGEGWKVNDDKQAVLARGAPTQVAWRVPYDAGWNLQLLKHPWSGQAEVEWIGERRRLNLYGANTFETVPLSGRAVQGPLGLALNAVVVLSDLLTGTALMLMLVMAARARMSSQ